MPNFRAQNTIAGKEGRIFIDGNEMGYAKSVEATIGKTKSEVPILGRRMAGHKTTGATGTGTLVLYKVTSTFIRHMLNYLRTGEDLYFTLQFVLDDRSSGRGTERVVLFDCNFDSVELGKINVETEALEESIPFTFEDADLPEALRGTF
ncbi:phage tail tube protein [Aureibacillus halotolerans]|uniref:Tail tube protein n=1 Tax=Aureibacillus halotolerans TaxID=1508390 RepID=A0A4R6TTJ2_9BACI|nr:phage tail tube protein [Aureibacillus halotolerans]TDQ35283.1 tail tube protein [Aureibacillus halotolerans]